MNSDMDTPMREAIDKASRTSHGYLTNVPEATLQKLEAAGLAIRDEDETEHRLTEEGFKVNAVPDPTTSKGVSYHLSDRARWEIPITLTSPVEDVVTRTAGAVRPNSATISLVPNRAGWWTLSHVAVWGPRVKDGKVTTKRVYSVLFGEWAVPGDEMPDWLREICQYWVDRANGTTQEKTFDELLEESSLGAPHVKAATEQIPADVRRRLQEATQKTQPSPGKTSVTLHFEDRHIELQMMSSDIPREGETLLWDLGPDFRGGRIAKVTTVARVMDETGLRHVHLTLDGLPNG